MNGSLESQSQLTDGAHAVGRGARDAIDEEDGAVFMTDQDDDDEHVKLLNPVKVGILFGAAAGSKVQSGTTEFVELDSHGTSYTCPWFIHVTLQGVPTASLSSRLPVTLYPALYQHCYLPVGGFGMYYADTAWLHPICLADSKTLLSTAFSVKSTHSEQTLTWHAQSQCSRVIYCLLQHPRHIV